MVDLIVAAYDRLQISSDLRFTRTRMIPSWFQRGTKDFPALRGKAAQIAALAAPLSEVAATILDTSVQHEAWMLLGLRNLAECERILGRVVRDPWRLAPPDQRVFQQAVIDFVDCNVALRSHLLGHVHAGNPVLFFHMAIKFHYVLHVAARSAHESPRMSWCYSGESFMMLVRNLVAASCRGTAECAVPSKVTQKGMT